MVEIFNLIHHLKRCPEEFLHTWVSKPGKKPQADVLVKDIYRRIIGDFTVPDSDLPDINKGFWQLDENQVISIQIGCWFFSYPFFLKKLPLLPLIHLFLFNDLMEVCKFVKYREWVEDDDRAEEFIRLALKICDILPDGESAAEASDKLEALDTVKRQEVLRESNASMDRILEIRRQMAEQKAREAANVYSRE